MNCKKCKKTFSTYLDGQLDSEQKLRFENHLEICARCAEDFAKFKKVISLTGELPVIQLSSNFDRALQEKLNESEPKKRYAFPFRQRYATIALAFACLVLISIIGFHLMDYQQNQKTQQIIAGRETDHIIADRYGNLRTFVMPNVPSINVTQNLNNVGFYEKHLAKDFILPQVTHASEDNQNTDYVLKKAKLINASEEGFWQ